ncbi:transferrin-binding protein-like solute binding protein [Neomegalonema sp.]|uniref:transferrin-binding protein-like solute binding protein n=1 Tax=Neomegalonema sp. TaxID=2039713 RepID=UPI00261F8AAD|nr:transferrin-binding protein-like solute binding protein [Neomegalonema sp.]MDD2867210.1 transferrin-binding protein-like solute binding protein [Neomegalonema sp.]
MGQSAFLRILVALAAPTLLAACGGGGDKPSSFAATPAAFSAAPGKTVAPGFGRSFVVQQGEKVGDARRTGFSALAANELTLSRDAQGAVSEIALTTPDLSTSWSKDDKQLALDDGLLVGYRSKAGRTQAAVIASPDQGGFAHQTFGFWYDVDAVSGLNRFGSLSAGEETAAADLPKSGKATFVGEATGMRTSAGDSLEFRIVRAQARIEADFARRSASFSTTGSSVGRDAQGEKILDESLDMTGALSAGADGRLSGKVRTAGGLSGGLDARFYGPDATEIGGIFALEGPGAESFSGGFGAKKQ